MMKHLSFKHLFALVLALAAQPAFGAGEGTAVGVNPDAAARLSNAERVLQIGSDISVGELVVTGPAGQVQIVFDDNTRLVVGPRSSLLIETYLMASANTAQKLTVNALGGSFRFITGNSAKPAYSIRTPTAAIAVRGTEFDLIVEPRSTRVMLYEGALQLCNTGSDCEELNRRCEVATATNQESTLYLRDNPQRVPLSLEFRYARFQAPLLPQFRVSGAAACSEEIAPAFSSQSLNPGSGGAPTGGQTPTPGPGPTPTPTPGNRFTP